MRTRLLAGAAMAAIAMLIAADADACSACGCTLSSDWSSQGLAATGGWRADLRFDFFDQECVNCKELRPHRPFAGFQAFPHTGLLPK